MMITNKSVKFIALYCLLFVSNYYKLAGAGFNLNYNSPVNYLINSYSYFKCNINEAAKWL